MFKRIIAMVLCICSLVGVLMLNTPSVSAASTYRINNVKVSYKDTTSYSQGCWDYAKFFYKKIWGKKFSISSTFGESTNMLKKLSDTQLELTTKHLKAYVSQAALGSVLRICNKKYLHGYDQQGHSVVIVQKDKNGFTVFEGGLSKAPYPHCQEKYYTWSSFIKTYSKYTYIKYIKWPYATAFAVTVRLNDTSETMYAGQTKKLIATVNNGDSVKWTSSNSSVAKVNNNGTITAVRAGSAVISATVSGTKTKATCKITVKAPKLNITGKRVVRRGSKITLQASAPANTTIVWTSSDRSAATVSSSGVVKGLKSRRYVTITANIKGTSYKKSITVLIL